MLTTIPRVEKSSILGVNEVLGASGEGGDGSSDATGSATTAPGASDDTGSEEVGPERMRSRAHRAERSVLPRPVVSLAQEEVTATPGQPVRVKVTVRNGSGGRDVFAVICRQRLGMGIARSLGTVPVPWG